MFRAFWLAAPSAVFNGATQTTEGSRIAGAPKLFLNLLLKQAFCSMPGRQPLAVLAHDRVLLQEGWRGQLVSNSVLLALRRAPPSCV